MARKKINTSPSTSNKSVEQVMVVNDVPGEECRIALLENGVLEELYAERVAATTNVGNIYKGRVVNVEPAIQAAFIDYGAGQNGFLHISDLHPRYFPGKGDRTERVGKKIPRRERPLIQEALKRGDDILVQVIKEGIGTKGPTLTSYLSIPGRLMVMMPHMDRVGVSRRIEDEEKRREMREILDGLDLPEGIGFILRTAGFGRTKTELKRDLAFLNRLWKTMEKRIARVKAPCALYVETDLLIRTIRDVLSPSISMIIVDSESAHRRATDFLSVIAPRSAPKVIRWPRRTPIFHAFDIERQIDLIHQREVPLPSGGAIIIDQTEALVAIDVNSGKSRSARDSETNALNTNLEAADEICRHLRLRDLGGVIVNDLIDMSRIDNRKVVEQRFRDNLARDRARTTIARISEFGILEMTRQRMRPSMRKTHFQPCPFCEGRGEVRTPESIAGTALRHVAYLLQHDRIQTVEIVCSPRVASAFLSSKRRELVGIEDLFEKGIRIRVSETIPTSRVDYYAYDDRSADVDVSRLPSVKKPSIAEIETEAAALAEREVAADAEAPAAPEREKKPASGGGRGRTSIASLESAMAGDDFADDLEVIAEEELAEDEAKSAAESQPRTKKRRRRRRKSDQPRAEAESAAVSDDAAASKQPDSAPSTTDDESTDDGAPTRKKRRRRRRRKSGASTGESSPESTASESSSKTEGAPAAADQQPSSAGRTSTNGRADGDGDGEPEEESAAPRKKKRRRRKRSSAVDREADQTVESAAASTDSQADETRPAADDGEGGSGSSSRRRKRRKKVSAPTQGSDEPAPSGSDRGKAAGSDAAGESKAAPTKSKPRTLYRAYRKVKPDDLRSAREQER